MWGTRTQHLASGFDKALPDWDAMMPDDQDDNDEDFKSLPAMLKVQKKACRSKKVLGDTKKSQDIELQAYLGAPLERLISSVQYLNKTGKGWYDTVMACRLDPFLTCRKEIGHIVSDGARGPLKPLFAQTPAEAHEPLLARLRAIGLDMSGQRW